MLRTALISFLFVITSMVTAAHARDDIRRFTDLPESWVIDWMTVGFEDESTAAVTVGNTDEGHRTVTWHKNLQVARRFPGKLVQPARELEKHPLRKIEIPNEKRWQGGGLNAGAWYELIPDSGIYVTSIQAVAGHSHLGLDPEKYDLFPASGDTGVVIAIPKDRTDLRSQIFSAVTPSAHSGDCACSVDPSSYEFNADHLPGVLKGSPQQGDYYYSQHLKTGRYVGDDGQMSVYGTVELADSDAGAVESLKSAKATFYTQASRASTKDPKRPEDPYFSMIPVTAGAPVFVWKDGQWKLAGIQSCYSPSNDLSKTITMSSLEGATFKKVRSEELEKIKPPKCK